MDAKLIDKRKARELQNKFNSLLNKYKKTMGNETAAGQAAADIINVEANRTIDKKRNTIRAALATEATDARLDALGEGKYGKGVRDLFESTLSRTQTVERQILQRLDRKFLEKAEANLLGEAKSQQGMDDIIRMVLGERALNPENAKLKAVADSITDSFDYMHKRFKAGGGVIGKIDRYFPQIHEGQLIREVSFDDWYSFLRPRIDLDRMTDLDTGLPFTEMRLKTVLEETYNNIITGGLHSLQKQEIGTFRPKKDISLRRENSRFIHFKDADSFLDYNRAFGVGDERLTDLVLNHVKSMSRDIGLLEMMGPKPKDMAQFLLFQMAIKGSPETSIRWSEGMFKVLTGSANAGVDSRYTRTLGTIQNFLRSALLGSASISAISDTVFLAAAARAKGLPTIKVMNRYLKLMNPLSSADRTLAKRHGYLMEVMSSSIGADARFAGETLGGRATNWLDKSSSRVANFTNRASGLQAMTKAASDAISLEFEATLAETVLNTKNFNNIPKEFRSALLEHGIGEKEWGILKKVNVLEEPNTGTKFLRSQDIVSTKGLDSLEAMDVANKLDDMISGLRNLVTNEPSLRTKSIATAFGARRDNALRWMSSSAFMFKSFPVTVLFNHIIPSLQKARKGELEQLMIIGLGTTSLGYGALQLKEITKGKQPKELNGKLLIASLLQGGGLGLFGDFLLADYSRFGRSPLSELGGPIAGLADDLYRATKGQFDRFLDGKDPNFKRDIFRIIKRNLPGVSLWYSRLVLERLLLDQIEKQIDPDYDRRTRRYERKINKEFGQKFWWRPGRLEPTEAPIAAAQ